MMGESGRSREGVTWKHLASDKKTGFRVLGKDVSRMHIIMLILHGAIPQVITDI